LSCGYALSHSPELVAPATIPSPPFARAQSGCRSAPFPAHSFDNNRLLRPFCNDPRQFCKELNCQNALTKGGGWSWQLCGSGYPILKTGMSICQAFTRCGEFASTIEPSAICSQCIGDRPTLVDFSLFDEVDAKLIEEEAEGLRVSNVPLCREVPAIGASAPFRITSLHRGVGCFGAFTVVADRLVAELNLGHLSLIMASNLYGCQALASRLLVTVSTLSQVPPKSSDTADHFASREPF
jgi:hypothetical protein